MGGETDLLILVFQTPCKAQVEALRRRGRRVQLGLRDVATFGRTRQLGDISIIENDFEVRRYPLLP